MAGVRLPHACGEGPACCTLTLRTEKKKSLKEDFTCFFTSEGKVAEEKNCCIGNVVCVVLSPQEDRTNDFLVK